MILIIDNYDSFVYNLSRYVTELKLKATIVRNDAISIEEITDLSPSHIILSPGPCTPNEAGICLSLIQSFLDKIPILGVCLGHQAIAQACGAHIVRAANPMHGKATPVLHYGKDIFEGLPHPLTAGRYHSLIVSDQDFPDCLEITAQTAAQEIMALRHREYPVFGVQFHPESILTDAGHQLLSNFFRV